MLFYWWANAGVYYNTNKLVSKAYQEECYMNEKGEQNWVSIIKTILQRCDILQYWGERQAVPIWKRIS